MKARVASFLVPLLTAVILLYQVLGSLQIAVMHSATLLVIGVTLAAAAVAGLLAAIGPVLVRVAVFALCAFLFADVTFHLSAVFDRLRPEARRRLTRDDQRVADLHRIKAALDDYVARVGPLPMPEEYGEAAGPPEFWKDWWDVSSQDRNGDGVPFLDFLVHEGMLPAVPVDPVNAAPDADPRSGKQYIYFIVPPDYDYAGGTCDARPNRWHYMVAITKLEDEATPQRAKARGSGCECLWRDQPNFFREHFDYVLCGAFDATPERRAQAAEARVKRTAAVAAEKHRAATRIYEPDDRRRVADLLQIRQGLEKYLKNVGPLPAPREYGEAEASRQAGFWKGYWDVSGEDGDRDGVRFLDFLVESGTMPSVPVDPENAPAADGDPRGGRQYVYFLANPGESYESGTCAPDRWIYMLGITDLRTEIARPPLKMTGSGCDCLWRNKPDFFQQHFDYVVCGTFQGQ
jgi:hypothetical protein